VACVDQTRLLLWVQKGWDGEVVFGPAPVRTGYEDAGGWHRVSLLDLEAGHFLTTRDGGSAGPGASGGCVALRHEDARRLWRVLDAGDWVYVFGDVPSPGVETCA
jgi:hypothetical protein